LEKVLSRDFFGAHGRSEADAQMAESIRLFKEFSSKVYAREGVEEPVDTEDGESGPPGNSPH
jgi:hypothetical protein